VPFLNLSENKKGANSMARRDQQIDASNFVYSFDRKIAPFLKITASKRAPHGSEFANRRKKGVRIPPVRGKQWLASMESFVNFRAKKARKRLMPLAFRQWHLYRFAFMVTRWRFELQTHCLKGIFKNFFLKFCRIFLNFSAF